MVRTRGDSSTPGSSAGRKAVVARAPRKALGSSSSAVTPVSASKGGSKKGKHVGGNTMKMWPTPSWQKDLKAFLDVSSPTSSTSSIRTEGDGTQHPSMDESQAACSQSQDSTSSNGSSPVTTSSGSGIRRAHFEEDSDVD